jgi:hypothetical protein
MKYLVALGVAVGLLAAIGLAYTASAANSHTVVPVVKFNTTEVVPYAGARLARTDGGVSGSILSVGLPGDHAYTVWWVVFNDPSGCVAGCGLDDVLAAVGPTANDNPANIGVFYAAGHYVGVHGTGGFGASLREGDTSYCVPAGDGPFSALCNPLVDAHTADVHLVVRDHGPMIPGQLKAQISSFTGGCSAYACANLQAAIFEPYS